MSTERRQIPRHKSLLRGLAYLGDSPSATNCLVRDISDNGARLKFGGSISAPDTLDLQIPAKNQTLHCKVIWRESDELGVAFIKEANVKGQPAGDDELATRVERLEAEIDTLKQMIKRLQQSAKITDAA